MTGEEIDTVKISDIIFDDLPYRIVFTISQYYLCARCGCSCTKTVSFIACSPSFFLNREPISFQHFLLNRNTYRIVRIVRMTICIISSPKYRDNIVL